MDAIDRRAEDHPMPRCANLRCSREFTPERLGQRFCRPNCRGQWNNLVRSACLEAADLLIEHRMQPRMSKKERKVRTERAKRLGKAPPPFPKKGLLTKAFRVVDMFISAERAIRDNPAMVKAPRPHKLRD